VYNILVRKFEGQRLLGRLSRDVRIILKLILKEQVWEGVYWLHVSQNIFFFKSQFLFASCTNAGAFSKWCEGGGEAGRGAPISTLCD
jgi:hypothetical protein